MNINNEEKILLELHALNLKVDRLTELVAGLSGGFSGANVNTARNDIGREITDKIKRVKEDVATRLRAASIPR